LSDHPRARYPERLIASCACGNVQLEANGQPIVGAVCYCDDCQAAAEKIEALPGAAPLRQSDGGTAVIVYRKDRVRFTQGASQLKKWKLREGSAANRRIATCCNSVMLIDFDDAKHWVDVYRVRVSSDVLPEPELRVCTKFAAPGVAQAAGPPAYAAYPFRFVLKLIKARVAMLFSRK
jgi:hypothetical protein